MKDNLKVGYLWLRGARVECRLPSATAAASAGTPSHSGCLEHRGWESASRAACSKIKC